MPSLGKGDRTWATGGSLVGATKVDARPMVGRRTGSGGLPGPAASREAIVRGWGPAGRGPWPLRSDALRPVPIRLPSGTGATGSDSPWATQENRGVKLPPMLSSSYARGPPIAEGWPLAEAGSTWRDLRGGRRSSLPSMNSSYHGPSPRDPDGTMGAQSLNWPDSVRQRFEHGEPGRTAECRFRRRG